MKEFYQLVQKVITACEDISKIRECLEQLKSQQEPDNLSIEQVPPDELDRQGIKKQLDELKISYQPRAKTEVLAKLLESVDSETVEIVAPLDTPVEPAPNKESEVTKPEQVAPETKVETESKGSTQLDQARDKEAKVPDLKDFQIMFRAYAIKNGIDPVRKVLLDHNAQKVSDLSESQRIKIWKELNE